MKTLLDSTETSATYKFESGNCQRQITLVKPEDADSNPDFEMMAEAEYGRWLAWLNQ